MFDFLVAIQNGGRVTVCLDGNFGLVRRKKAGQAVHVPQSDIFIPDDEVNEFVDSYNKDRGDQSKDVSYTFCQTAL